jgi:hypothetical protein
MEGTHNFSIKRLLRIPILIAISAHIICISFSEKTHLHNQHCETQKDCEDFMMCLDNECVCDFISDTYTGIEENPTNVDFINLNNLCTSEKCDNTTNSCGQNAFCNSDGICNCSDGYERETLSHKCKLPFGSKCSSTEACNTDKFLTCIYGTCRCHNEQDTAFDPIKNTCVGKLGANCELQAWMGLQLGCGHNAECSKAVAHSKVDKYEDYGICNCSVGFVPNQSQPNKVDAFSCVPSFGTQCRWSWDCGSDEEDDLNMICSGNKCACKSGSVYDQDYNQCKLLVGNDCKEFGAKCVNHAQCQMTDSPKSGWRLACQCENGFMPDSSRTCSLGYGSVNCSNSLTKCNSDAGLVCLDDECFCKDNFSFDPDTKSCVPSDCNGMTCDSRNSYCNPDTMNCECNPKFSPDPETGRCEFMYGAKCKSLPDQNKFCRLDLGLSCRRRNDTSQENYCLCTDEDLKLFDDEAGQCLHRLGHPCSLPHKRCITNAFCGTGNKCQCYSGFSPNADGNCLLEYEQSCGTSRIEGKRKTCNDHEGLLCFDDKCSCPVGQHYDRKVKQCCTIKSKVDEDEVEREREKDNEGKGYKSRPFKDESSNSSSSTVSPMSNFKIYPGFMACLNLMILVIFVAVVFIMVWRYSRRMNIETSSPFDEEESLSL